jgi:hypothetical protein
MTDPFVDDSWDELTRELGVEKSPPAADPLPSQDEPLPENFEGDAPADDEFDGSLSDDGEAPDGAEPPGDDQPGTGRKRRRRRRRRKKGGEPGQPEPVGVGAETVAEPAMQETGFSEEYETGPGSESDEQAGQPIAADEDTAGEVLRELIANWNVPSWDSIVTGLHRPGQ